LNFGSDSKVRNAFRATLLDEPSSANLVAATQEVDALDILEVTDLANAIAAAEEAIRARSSRALASGPDSSTRLDLFDRLGKADHRSGPAAPAGRTPPPARARTTTLLPPHPSELRPTAHTEARPNDAPPAPPAAHTAPILILDEDAFYYPAGRIRTLADVTLDGERPDSTLLVRLRARKEVLSRVVLAIFIAMLLLALFAAAVSVGRATVQAAASPSAPPSEVAPAHR
jgi:hypothetical protein